MEHTQLAVLLARGLGLVMAAYTAYFFILALFSLRKPKEYPRRPPAARFAVLVAARNEEAVIGGLVESLVNQDYPKELFDVIVLPNNCTDNTALAAKKAGATVLECPLPTRSKGEVLDYALSCLFRREKRYDAVCVFDADNLVHPEFLSRMNDAWQAGARVAQGYRDSKNPTDTAISGCYSIYYWTIDLFYSQARANLGMNAIINGSGFMVSMELLRKQGGWKTATITEDIEFSALCAIQNQRIWWVPQAVTFDEQPLTFAQSWKQRKRWSTGMIQCMERYAAPLFEGALRGSVLCLDSLFFFILPVIQLLGLPAMAGCLTLRPDGIFLRVFLGLALSILTAFLGALLAVAANGKPARPMLRGMAWYWAFLLSWLPINLLCLVKKTTRWEAIPHTRALSLSQLDQAG